jgi:hypothetical protein
VAGCSHNSVCANQTNAESNTGEALPSNLLI